ncbi:unnamed protein product, partial [Brenthis ino]
MRVIQTFSFHLCISTVLAVYDSRSMRLINAPETLNNKSNFGFSITYFNKQLFISAPTADNIGKIFSYDVIKKSFNEIAFKLERESPSNYTNDYWLGAYLTSGSKYVVTCAPRTIYKYVKLVTKGVCYKFSSSDDIVQLSDMELPDRKPLNGGVESFGWIVDINNQTNIIAIGGQGVGPGGVEIYENYLTPPRTLITDTPNLGYSIASGNFLSDEEIIYAISTPYGEHGEGRVYFYDKLLKKIKLLDVGEVGSIYGAVLCAARLGHTRTSLLVGAPTFASNSRYNTGAVYVYVPAEKAKLLSSAPQLIRILKGTVDGGYFGASIVSLGDIDGDGRDEVAIGAPYDGEGAVYIYTGFSLLNDKTWLRKIQPEKFKSFGFSLAPIPDVSGTKCNGLGVGAPLSNYAFILKCIPILTVKLDAELPNVQKKTNDGEYYKFRACLNVSYPLDPIKIRSQIELKIDVIHAAAKLVGFGDDLEPSIFDLEERLPRICKDFIVTMSNGNYEELIKFNFTAKINAFKSTIFSAPEVILSDRSVLTLQKSVCAADCKLSCRCVPKLRTVTLQTTLTNPYKVGLQSLERFSVLVQNLGETAYDACVVISVSNAFVQNISPSCSRYNSTRKFLCRPPQKIPTGIIWPVGDIGIDTSALTNKDDHLGIQYDIYGHCENETEKHTEEVYYPLIFDYDVFHISGASIPNKVLNITDNDVGSVKKIQHVYTISNKGYIDFYEVFIRIKLQRKNYINYQTPVLKLIRENETLSIECSHKTMVVKGVTNMLCSFELLKASEALLFLSIDVLPNNLGEIENNATVLSEVHLLLSEKRLIARVETKLMLLSVSIPNWIWIVAVLSALLILLIVVLILRRCGYFKRQNKERLQSLRKSRRIQTEMRYINKDKISKQDTPEINEKQEEIAT